jgi:5-methylthioadenosine/S-adenosylhomocysteine deaminase
VADTRITNARILPIDGRSGIIDDGEIVIRDGFIAEVRPEGSAVAGGRVADNRAADGAAAETVIDADGRLVMPGLVNTHTHSAMTLLRSYADDLPLMDWLQNEIWPVEGHLSAEDVYWGTALAAVEMLKSGTTTCSDMYFFMSDAARAYSDVGIRAVVAPGLFSFSDEPDRRLAEAAAFCREWQGAAGGRITTMLAPHAPYTVDADYMGRILETAADLGIPIHTHVSETKGEVEDSYAQHGMSPVRYLEKLGVLGHEHLLAAHCVHLNEEDISILGERHVAVAHNPQCNMKLGNGVAPVVELAAAGATVGLATDGVASNNNLNLWEEMRMAAFLQKGHYHDTTRLPAATALEMGTRRGAAALALGKQTGSIEVGKQADLIFVDLQQPQFQPIHDITANLVYSAYGSEVSRVLVAGTEVVRDGRMTMVDEAEIYARAREQAERLIRAAGRTPHVG